MPRHTEPSSLFFFRCHFERSTSQAAKWRYKMQSAKNTHKTVFGNNLLKHLFDLKLYFVSESDENGEKTWNFLFGVFLFVDSFVMWWGRRRRWQRLWLQILISLFLQAYRRIHAVPSSEVRKWSKTPTIFCGTILKLPVDWPQPDYVKRIRDFIESFFCLIFSLSLSDLCVSDICRSYPSGFSWFWLWK